ncbi:hypothetical protein OIU74_010257, partial [Salix koriyanagi]
MMEPGSDSTSFWIIFLWLVVCAKVREGDKRI